MKNAWTKVESKEVVFSFADDYIKYLDKSKTERNCVSYTEELAKAQGFVNFDDVSSLKAGDKVYKINRGKNIVLAKIGSDDITKGVNITASHIDSPRIDIKQNPLYEDSGLVLLDTHYYGGIREYQWVTIPLSLIGVVITKDGRTVDISIGENENDPVFIITDLLPHLAKDQKGKKLTEAFPGESLDVLAGSFTLNEEGKEIKEEILKLLEEKYGIEEEDFVSAELEIVPAFKARSVGLDSSLIGAYGQDDRICAYTSLRAIFDCDDVSRTAICFLADKEETGSLGNTGMQSEFFATFLAELIEKCNGTFNDLDLRRTLANSFCLSADVAAGVDPLYKSVLESKNAAFIGGGVAICKYTGSGGKSGTSDANAEMVAKVRKIFNDAGVVWQVSELGKVGQGGGGTVAKYIANLNVETIDVGTPVLCMHAPYEISSKVDTYMTYLGYKAFYNA